MKTLAVTYDDRARWREYATIHARWFTQLNGIEAEVLPVDMWPRDLCFPHYGKLWIWDMVPADVDRLIWFDSDLIPVRPMGDLPSAAMSMVVDNKAWVVSDIWSRIETLRGVWPYWNTGFIVMHRSAKWVFDECKKLVPKPNDEHENQWGWLWDQNVINHVISVKGFRDKVTTLHPIYNYHSGLPRPIPCSVKHIHITTWSCIGQHKEHIIDLVHNSMSSIIELERGVRDARTTVYS